MSFKSPLHDATNHRNRQAELLRGVAQSIPNDTQTAIDFDNFSQISNAPLTRRDGSPIWTVGDPTNVFLDRPGLYILEAEVEWNVGAVGYREVAQRQGALPGIWRFERFAATPTLGQITHLTATKVINAGATFQTGIAVRHTQGAALLAITPTLTITYIAAR